MPTLTFEAESHGELVIKVKRWLASVEGNEENLSVVQVVERSSELVKEALRIVASAAPGPVAESDIVKGLTNVGYKVTDGTKNTLVKGLDSIDEITGGGVVKQVGKAGRKVAYQMNVAVARQVLKTVRNR